MVRVAFIGAGKMANRVHFPSLKSFQDVEIVGICDNDKVNLKTTANKYEIEKQYSNYKQMIEELSPDAVYAIGKPNQMFDIWIWCLENGLNLYIEKPMGITMHQSYSLAYIAEKNNCITQVSFQRRTCPMVEMLRNECLKRGPIFQAVCSFYKNSRKPNFDSLDHMINDGVHLIDTLRWMCGGKIVDIQSFTSKLNVHEINQFSSILTFDNGANGILIYNCKSGRRIFKVEMHAPGICVEVEHENKGYLYIDGDSNGIEYNAKEVSGSEDYFVYGGFQAKNREFINCIKKGINPSSNFSDSLITMEIAAKILAKALLTVK